MRWNITGVRVCSRVSRSVRDDVLRGAAQLSGALRTVTLYIYIYIYIYICIYLSILSISLSLYIYIYIYIYIQPWSELGDHMFGLSLRSPEKRSGCVCGITTATYTNTPPKNDTIITTTTTTNNNNNDNSGMLEVMTHKSSKGVL